MQGDNFSAHEVVAGRDIAREGESHFAAAEVEVLGAPVVVVAGVARGVLGPGVGVDFEEARAAVCGAGVGYLGEVDVHGAVVGAADAVAGAGAVAWLSVEDGQVQALVQALEWQDILVHLNGQGIAGLDAAAGSNSAAVLVAADIVAHHVLDGRV